MILSNRFWYLLVFGVWWGFGQAAGAAESPVNSAVLERVGFDGRFKVGQWTPLEIRLESNRACRLQLELETPDPEGNRTISKEEFSVKSAGTFPLKMLFQPGRLETALRLKLTALDTSGDQTWTVPVSAGNGPAAQFTQKALTQSVLLVGSLGGLTQQQISPDSTEDFEPTPDQPVPIFVAALKDPALLTVTNSEEPQAAFTNALGLEALDVIVVSGHYQMPPVQSEALRTWVSLGGHLILSIGKDLPEYEHSPLADWVSGEKAKDVRAFRVSGQTSYKILSSLESFVGKSADRFKLNLNAEVPGVLLEPGPHAETLLNVLSGPLIVRAPYGMGTVTMIGVSIGDDPLVSWPALPAVMQKLLMDQTQQSSTQVASSSNTKLSYSGISEFSTQLQTALMMFPTIQRFSTWLIIGVMLGYLLVIGPLDYFLVHRVLKRPRLTWLTLPIFVMAAGAIFASKARTQNGEGLMVTQVDVLDFEAQTNTLHVRTWLSVYSPETRRYQISLAPNQKLASSDGKIAKPPEVRMSWFGVPETTFGGMYREGGVQMSAPIYRFSPQAAGIENLPIPIWGAKTLSAQWNQQGKAWVISHLESPGSGQLRGTIEHNFPVPITDWFLAYNSRVFLPRPKARTSQQDADQREPLLPGKLWPPNDPNWTRVNPREISGYLTNATAKKIKYKGGPNANDEVSSIRLEQQPYNPLDPDNPQPFADILRVLSFHRQVGGKKYTNLENHALGDMDFSRRLNLNQAVLFGRLDWPASELSIKDHAPTEQRRATFVRIVLPVQRTRKDDGN